MTQTIAYPGCIKLMEAVSCRIELAFPHHCGNLTHPACNELFEDALEAAAERGEMCETARKLIL